MAFKHNTSDTADGILTQSEYESTSGHILDSQAAGDMIVADTTTTMTRLAVGSANQVLTSDGSTPTYSKITTSNINASTLVIESEGIGSNDNDTTIPTSAAVKAYVDSQIGSNNELSEILGNGNTTGGTDLSISSGDSILLASGVDLNWNSGNVTVTHSAGALTVASASNATFAIHETTSGGDGTVASILNLDGDDSGGNQTTYARVSSFIVDETDTTEDGRLLFGVMDGGTITDVMRVQAADASPNSDGGLTLGTASRQWGASFFNGDMTINDGAGLVVGHTAQVTATGTSNIPKVQVLGTDGNDTRFLVGRWNETNTLEPMMAFLKSGNDTIGSNTIVADGENVGTLNWYVDDGNDYSEFVARISAEVDDSSPAENQIGGALVFNTTATNGTDTEALRIDSSQNSTFAGSITTTIDGVALAVNSATSGQDVAIRIATTAGGNADSSLEFYEGGTDRGGIKWGGTLNQYEWDGGALNFSGGNIYIGDTSNANMTAGLTINQGANDNEILALKSSDIAHRLTGITEADTYAAFEKNNGASGGLEISSFVKSASGGAALKLSSHSDITSSADTAKNGSGFGFMTFDTWEKDGTTGRQAATDTNANLFSFRNGTTSVFLIDIDGDYFYDGTGTAYDFDPVTGKENDDLDILRSFTLVTAKPETVLQTEFDQWLNTKESDLVRLGILGDTVANGGLVNGAKLAALHTGAIHQMNTKHMSLAEEVKSLKAEIKALTEGK